MRMSLVEFVMPLLSVNTPVLPAMDETPVLAATEETVAFLIAAPATSQMINSSAVAGVALFVRPSIVKSCAFAVDPVALPLIVLAAICAALALVTALAAIVVVDHSNSSQQGNGLHGGLIWKPETVAYPRDYAQPIFAEAHKQLKTNGFREPY